MATKLTANTLKSKYRDDFDIEKGYHRILFNNERHLQARELTQLQTIIQEELAIFGRNMFKEGAAANPGGAKIDRKIQFIKLDAVTNLPSDITTLIGRTFEGATTGIRCTVVDILAATATDPATLYVRYTDRAAIAAGVTSQTTSPVVAAGEDLNEVDGNAVLKVQTTNTTLNPATGKGTTISVNQAEFFALGFFVRAPSQTIYLSKYSDDYTGTIGFRAYEEVITPNDDPSLFDNQGLLPNTTAPGADRLKITLELIDKANISSSDTFIYYATIENSKAIDQVTGYEGYNKINELIAKRTEEESGDYTVQPFKFRFDEHETDSTKLTARISPGIAYVNGFRITKPTPTFIDVDKSINDEITYEDDAVGVDYGYYVIVDELQGLPGVKDLDRLVISSQSNAFLDPTTTPAIDTGSDAAVFPLNSGNAPANASSTYYWIGTCRIKAVEAIGNGQYKVYLMDIQMLEETNSGSAQRINLGEKFTFKDYARSIGVPKAITNAYGVDPTVYPWTNVPQLPSSAIYTPSYVIPALTGNKVLIKEVNNSDMIFPVGRRNVKNISSMQGARIQKTQQVTLTSNSITQISVGTGSGTLSNSSDWIILKPEGDGTYTPLSVVTDVTISGIGTTSGTIDINAGVFGLQDQVVHVVYYETASLIPSVKTKGLKQTTITYDPAKGYAELLNSDVIKVNVLKFNSASGPDAMSTFTLDNGQRDTHYQIGKLIAKSGRVPPSNTLYVEYEYYIHSTSGDFFCVNSYPSGEEPTYVNSNGNNIDLLQHLDFRPTRDDDKFVGGNSIKRPIPQDGDVLLGDITYYADRKDKLVLTELGAFNYVTGTPSDNPSYPQTPDNSMALYTIDMPGNVSSPDYVDYTMIDNRRYTMRDIGKLDKRITQIERTTALSLLELDTKNIDVLDADGRNRAKSGFFVDNFASGYNADTRNPEYRASIDILNKNVRPGYLSKHIGLYFEPNLSSNTVLKGDNVYLDYTEEVAISHDQANSTIQVNPYMTLDYPGHITLSPASDTWHVTEYMDPNIIDNGTVVHYEGALRWNDWNFNWHGVDPNQLSVGDSVSQTHVTGSTNRQTSNREGGGTRTTSWRDDTVTTVVNTITSSNIVHEEIGDREVSIDLIPFMRSRYVSFKGEGLMPNTRVWPFFDNADVSSWCRRESFSRKAIEMMNANIDADKIEPGNIYDLAQAIPGGADELYTDAQGTVEGVFFIPNNNTRRFRTGENEFKLLDISVPKEKDAISKAKTIFTSTGYLHTRQKDILSTRHLEVTGVETSVVESSVNWTNFQPDPGDGDGGDPIAQSFKVTDPAGMFATKVTVYFESKDENPVWVQLRPMVNGYPSSTDILPGSYKLLQSSDVVTSADATVGTDFEFDEPVYLKGNTEYAVMVQTVTPAYKVWMSKVGEFELGTTEKRISKQAFYGSLFKSQNASTWEALQWEDLKFDLHKANFGDNASGKAVLVNHSPPRKLLQFEPIVLWWDDDPTETNPQYIKILHPGHGFQVGNTVTIEGVDDSVISGLDALNDDHTIVKVDHTGYTINKPGGFSVTPPSPIAPTPVGGNSVIVTQCFAFNSVQPAIAVLEPTGSAYNLKGQFTSTQSYAGQENLYAQDPTEHFSLINNEDNPLDNYPRVIRDRGQENPASYNAVSKSAVVTVNMTSSNKYVTPVVDMQRASLTMIENVIDNPGTGNGYNEVIGFVAETSATGGSAAAKHVTKPVSLLNNASGLKVLIAANRPSVCRMDVYYRTTQGSDGIYEKEWTLATPDSLVPSDENKNIFRDYEYTIGGVDGTLDDFDTFQLKLVFTSTTMGKVPVVRDLRAIALAN